MKVSILTMHLASFPYRSFLVDLKDFLYKKSCYLWIKTVLFLYNMHTSSFLILALVGACSTLQKRVVQEDILHCSRYQQGSVQFLTIMVEFSCKVFFLRHSFSSWGSFPSISGLLRGFCFVLCFVSFCFNHEWVLHLLNAFCIYW